MKTRKRIIIAISALIFAICIAIGARIMIDNYRDRKQQEELEMAFERQNIVFSGLVSCEDGSETNKFLPMCLCLGRPHIDGVNTFVYTDLALFRKETGSSLTYEQVLDYLSQEFEDDGEIRIFTNGRHPEIAAYVEWYGIWPLGERFEGWENWKARLDYNNRLSLLHSNYFIENEGFYNTALYNLPISIIDELIKKEADPDYVLDLTSIQNRYIAEGRAIVSEDGISIEYIVPEQ